MKYDQSHPAYRIQRIYTENAHWLNIRMNLSYFLRRDAPGFDDVERHVRRLTKHIPPFQMPRSPECLEHDPSLQRHLVRELTRVFASGNTCRHVVRTRRYRNHDFRNFYLERLSIYRGVAKWFDTPLGLALEAWAAAIPVHCPVCDRPLVLAGGLHAPWADLRCNTCRDVFVEVKSRRQRDIHKVRRSSHIAGGSYRWFVSQRRAGVRHFLLLVPSAGGLVAMAEVLGALPSVDSKFCAYYNTPTMRRHATLRSYARLGPLRSVGYVYPQQLWWLDTQGRHIVCTALRRMFSAAARCLQRAWAAHRRRRSLHHSPSTRSL